MNILRKMFQFIFVFILAFGTTVTNAEEKEGFLNKLLAPGKLISGHKQLESDCLKCHEAGKGVLDSKCLECHKEIKKSVETKTGFHRSMKETCIECHEDHKGREFDSTNIDQKTFDHKKTGYTLVGEHEKIKCSECHTEKRSQAKKTIRLNEPHYLGLQTSCKSCHSKKDPHFFEGKWAKKDCSECHGMKKWTEDVKFDHFEVSKYKLVEKHAELKCAECHIRKTDKKPQYHWESLKKDQCLSCHADQHKNNLSPKFRSGKCIDCHTQKTWKIEEFDHSITRYELTGAHETLDCIKCHKQKMQKIKPELKNFKFTGLKQDCNFCHLSPHLKSFSPKLLAKKCSECHTDRDWKEILDKNFNHDANTRFKLTGKHKDTSCKSCHIVNKKQVYKFDTAEQDFCISCHKNQHEDQFSKKFSSQTCSSCHETKNFKELKNFDHSKTQFALVERHSELKCSECHKSDPKKMFEQDPAFVHAKHNTFTPHAKAIFKFKNGPEYCVSCHTNVHINEFDSNFNSKSCTACHNSRHFIPVKNFNHSSTSYELKGKHITVKCADCHKPTKIPRPNMKGHVEAKYIFPELGAKDCMTCHKDHHKGAYGPLCSSCHTEEKWKLTTDFHKNFTLFGTHFHLQCAECHRTSQKLAGLSENCAFCHRKDDVHQGTLGKCGECHHQQTWEVPNFKHSLTRFPLHGIHRTLECAECHRNGIYAGTPDRCQDCHQRDAQAFTGSPNHTVLLNRNCAECHTQFSFR